MINVVPSIVFELNTWLADGLLVNSTFGSVLHKFNAGCPLALSLLRYLCHELLAPCLAFLDVPHLSGYVFQFPQPTVTPV